MVFAAGGCLLPADVPETDEAATPHLPAYGTDVDEWVKERQQQGH